MEDQGEEFSKFWGLMSKWVVLSILATWKMFFVFIATLIVMVALVTFYIPLVGLIWGGIALFFSPLVLIDLARRKDKELENLKIFLALGPGMGLGLALGFLFMYLYG
jgi:hypothetical protein